VPSRPPEQTHGTNFASGQVTFASQPSYERNANHYKLNDLVIYWNVDLLLMPAPEAKDVKGLEFSIYNSAFNSLLSTHPAYYIYGWIHNSRYFSRTVSIHSMNRLLDFNIWEHSKSRILAIDLCFQWDPGIMKILMHAKCDVGELIGTLRNLLNQITWYHCPHGYAKKELVLYNFRYPSCVEVDTNAHALEQAVHISMCNNFCSFIHFGCCLQYKQWDPGVSSEVLKLSVAVTQHTTRQPSKLRKGTWCKMFNYKQGRAEQAIAWGQAMFLGGGNVMTVHVAALDWVIMGCGPDGFGLVPTLEL
jgi:hypothetical protein